MSDSHPTGPVFPPFGPALSRPSAPAPAVQAPPERVAAQPEPAAPESAAPEQAEPDLPFMAPFGGAEARTDEPAGFGGAAMPWEMPAEPEAAHADAASEPAEDAAEDLPWLEMPAAAPQARAEASAPAADEPWAAAPAEPEPAPQAEEAPAAEAAGGIADSDWMAWSAPAESPADAVVEPVEVEPTVAEFVPTGDFGGHDAEVTPAPGVVPVGDMSMVEPQVQAPPAPAGTVPAEDAAPAFDAAAPSYDAPDTSFDAQPAAFEAPAAEAEPTAPSTPQANGHFGEVVARLERIARALRDNPESFLGGGSSDPLDLLVTGFVLGAAQRRG